MFWSEFDPNRQRRFGRRLKRLQKKSDRDLGRWIRQREIEETKPVTRCTKATCETCGRHGVILHDRKATHGRCYGCGSQVKVQDATIVRGVKRAARGLGKVLGKIGRLFR
jgi:hypothetical protein